MADLIKKAKAALESATPGPWVAVGECYDDVRVESLYPLPEPSHAYGRQTVIGSSEWTYLIDGNAALIVLAPDIARALIAAAEAIEKLAPMLDDDPSLEDQRAGRSALAAFRAVMETCDA